MDGDVSHLLKKTYEESLLKILEQKKPADTDEDVNFALSLVPILQSLDDYTKIEARIQIMNYWKTWNGLAAISLQHHSTGKLK